MPFEKGRKKTGGKVKGGSFKNSKRFIDQLQRYGLNVAKELARGVLAIQDPTVRFNEVRRLLPYLVPELKPIDLPLDDENNPEAPISTEDLLGALANNGRQEKPDKPSTDPIPAVETRSVDVQVTSLPETDLPNMDGEQESD